MERHKFFTAIDPETRRQYFHLRAEEYTRTFGIDHSWLKNEDDDDHTGLILARRNSEGRLVAGVRMNTVAPGSPAKLPFEDADFQLRRKLPWLDLAQSRYAEVSRLAIAKEHQNGDMLVEMLTAIHDHSRDIRIVFSICPKPQARNYRILEHRGHLDPLNKAFHIYDDIPVERKNGIEMRLCAFADKGDRITC